jgi:hypothetical protein
VPTTRNQHGIPHGEPLGYYTREHSQCTTPGTYTLSPSEDTQGTPRILNRGITKGTVPGNLPQGTHYATPPGEPTQELPRDVSRRTTRGNHTGTFVEHSSSSLRNPHKRNQPGDDQRKPRGPGGGALAMVVV